MTPQPISSTTTKRRKQTTRVRSGCRTCKIRRIKCDELRPSCAKCVSSGRACDGYGIWSQPAVVLSRPRSQALSVFYPPQTVPGLDQEERGHLHRFRQFIAGRLAEPFGSYFWNSLVLQMSLSEPAVVHASIALTSAYELFLPSNDRHTLARSTSNGSFLLRQYNRAIRALTSTIRSDNPISLRIAAVSSVLFICLEILRGDLNAMQAHFSSGVKLLTQLQNRQDQSRKTSDIVLVKNDPLVYDDHLVTVFTQLNLQFLMLGNSSQQKETFVSPFHYSRRIHIPPRFYTGEEARHSFTSIVVAVTYLCKEFERTAHISGAHLPVPSIADLEKQQGLEVAMSVWIASYKRSIYCLFPSISPQERIGLSMLRIYADVFTIIIGTCLTIKETAYDPYLKVFDSLIRRYSNLTTQSSSAQSASGPAICKLDPCFTIDTGFFPPLYFTALKCRNHLIRRKALFLLQQYPTMEGPWTGPMVARVAGYVVDLEEKNFWKVLRSSPVDDCLSDLTVRTKDIPQTPQPSQTTPDVVLPEFCRIHCVECKLPNRLEKGSNVASLTLRRFQHELGKEGGWSVTSVDVDLSTSK
ncbi:hypothetical protein BJX63DRAFT_135343 [Aspergillus granulosus]|uniref:Zn(2)-C6 fungal-type domain-containing protein n=1 Tax=Aspergillus granulosus TaxID=176169 RepID=A0ABR4HMZ4_9EURO